MKRLCDDTLSADAARILRSAETDAPTSPDLQQARIIEAYGVARPALLASGLGFASLRRRKWAAIVGSFFIGGAIFVAWPRSGEKEPPARAHIEVPVIPITPLPAQTSEPTVRVEDLPAAPEVAKAASPRPSIVVIGDELAAIDASRAALRNGQPADALARIASCRKEFPHPMYAEEADALEVQALSALGRRDEARAKAALFFRAHPESPYEQRIRAAIADTQP